MFHSIEYKMNRMTRRKMIILLTVLIFSIICLNSCLYPEKFNITINITKDGKYSFVYDGVIIDDSIREAQIKGESSSETKKRKEVEEYLQKNPNFKEIKYVGEGKFKVLFKQEGDAKSETSFIDKDNKWISIEPLFSDIILIIGSSMDSDLEKTLKKLNFAIEGTMVVTTNAKVLGHNARTSPKLFGLVGNYTWEIKSFSDPAPKILIQFE